MRRPRPGTEHAIGERRIKRITNPFAFDHGKHDDLDFLHDRSMVELFNVTNATIHGGTLFLMKTETLKVPCSVELINFTSSPFRLALHNVKKCHHERMNELSYIYIGVRR
jgi:hypothetical protein